MGRLRLTRTYECRKPVRRFVVQHGELVLQAHEIASPIQEEHAIAASY